MKILFRQIDLLQLLPLILFTLPVLVVFGFGILWLTQQGNLYYWLITMLVCSGLGYGLQQLLVRREQKLLADAATQPNPDWPPNADVAWQRVKELADACNPEDWPLDDESWILELGQNTLETVSNYYHPDVDRPVLELTVPHALLIIEYASRDLRKDISENIPFSDRLTIGDLFRLQRWKESADRVLNVYRAGRMAINPLSGVTSEILRSLRERSFGLAKNELHRWLLCAYIRKVGYYAVDLYSGRQPLDQDEQEMPPTSASSADRDKAKEISKMTEEPLRILVLGRSNAGKSSLINALFGKLTTETDILPDTTQTLTPFVLAREGLTQALIFDSPGCDSKLFNPKQMQQAASNADLILWVSPVNRPDRQIERECLDSLRKFQTEQTDRHSAPILVAASYIDQLRPVRSWQPPYDLVNPLEAKASNISAAVQAVATDLAVAIDQVIPVCLLEGKTYNVDDTLWAAIMNQQDEALKARLHRYLKTKKPAEEWKLLRKQLVNAGRFLWQLPHKHSDD
ncbi:MAG: GTPase [Nitrosomonas sp.]|nr:GTPase [Nitrosomonas sp.]MDP1951562.1 GTPase [Nitrosomonas sp.]